MHIRAEAAADDDDGARLIFVCSSGLVLSTVRLGYVCEHREKQNPPAAMELEETVRAVVVRVGHHPDLARTDDNPNGP